MMTFAEVSDQQYIGLRSRLDHEDISKMTEVQMESILRNILGLQDDQRQKSYFTSDGAGDGTLYSTAPASSPEEAYYGYTPDLYDDTSGGD